MLDYDVGSRDCRAERDTAKIQGKFLQI